MIQCPFEITSLSKNELTELNKKMGHLPEAHIYDLFYEEGVSMDGGEIVADYSYKLIAYEHSDQLYFALIIYNNAIHDDYTEERYDICHGNDVEISRVLKHYFPTDYNDFAKKIQLLTGWVKMNDLDSQLPNENKNIIRQKI